MAAFPPGGWDIARPNVVSWYTELGTLPSSSSLNNVRSRLFTIGDRFDGLNRVITHNVGYDDAGDAKPIKPKDKKSRVDDALYMENVAAVRSLSFLFTSRFELPYP